MIPVTEEDIEYGEIAEDVAAELGMAVLRPTINQIFIDLDSMEAAEEFFRRAARCYPIVGDVQAEAWPSKTQGHYHVMIHLAFEVREQERLFLEACLGGDPVRALLAWRYVCHTSEPISCLFVPEGHHWLPAEVEA